MIPFNVHIAICIVIYIVSMIVIAIGVYLDNGEKYNKEAVPAGIGIFAVLSLLPIYNMFSLGFAIEIFYNGVVAYRRRKRDRGGW